VVELELGELNNCSRRIRY